MDSDLSNDEMWRRGIALMRSIGMPELVELADAFENYAEHCRKRATRNVESALGMIAANVAGKSHWDAFKNAMQSEQDMASDEVFALGKIVVAIGKVQRRME